MSDFDGIHKMLGAYKFQQGAYQGQMVNVPTQYMPNNMWNVTTWTTGMDTAYETPIVKPAKPAKPMKPPVAVPLSELMSELEEAGTERIKLFV